LKVLDVCRSRLHKITNIHGSDFMVTNEILPPARWPEGRIGEERIRFEFAHGESAVSDKAR